jgi:AraC family transcriptional regulator
MEIGGGNYAVGSFEVKSDEFGDAWNYMCGEWLPASGYQPADSAPFERYGANCETQDGKMKVDICVPVIPMQ